MDGSSKKTKRGRMEWTNAGSTQIEVISSVCINLAVSRKIEDICAMHHEKLRV